MTTKCQCGNQTGSRQPEIVLIHTSYALKLFFVRCCTDIFHKHYIHFDVAYNIISICQEIIKILTTGNSFLKIASLENVLVNR